MNSLSEDRYSKFALVKEMLETPGIVAAFNQAAADAAAEIAATGRLLMTAKAPAASFRETAILHSRRAGSISSCILKGNRFCEYDLSDWAVFGLSNSGQTAGKSFGCFLRLKETGHERFTA